ncbi:MAG: hypothetical protein Ct9H90mP8_2650 [Pseudomonadota bacterium]|nr:MAG: hypothetical protein Ct9H90mP8_2650 [Pseudomonadota bacterium]
MTSSLMKKSNTFGKMVQIFGLENGTLGKLIKFVQLPETDEMRKKPWPRFFDKRGYSLMMD